MVLTADLVSSFGIFDQAKVIKTPELKNEVLAAYEALSDEDIQLLLSVATDPDQISLLAGARVERSLFDGLDTADFYRFIARIDDMETDERYAEGSLSRKLELCVEAQRERDFKETVAAGGRRLEMFSIEGDVMLTRLLDEIINFPEPINKNNVKQLIAVYHHKIDVLARTYPEVADTAVREAIYADLEEHKVAKILLDTLSGQDN